MKAPMLKQRIATALLMLAVLLPALLHPNPEVFQALALALIALAAWEWSRLNRGISRQTLATERFHGRDWGFAAVCASVCALLWLAGCTGVPDLTVWRGVWLMAALAWVALAGAGLQMGGVGWARLSVWLRLALGLLVLVLAWVAICQMRSMGVHFLLSSMVLVWVADVAAYFGGRSLGRGGRHKLAPQISPGKTWEGALSGVAGVLLLAQGWQQIEHDYGIALTVQMPAWWGGATSSADASSSLYAHMATQPWPFAVAGLVFLTAMSVAGDLLESMVKRAAGAKDSSALLPGHGGVLDRLDALLPTLPLVMLWVSF
jgi:phosphatidate cytidylyltransferase